jgi:cell wall-associated NlpC family hydrolase
VATQARLQLPLAVLAAAAAAAVAAYGADAAGGSWAAPQIRTVTEAGVLGTSPAGFRPQAPLTQEALAAALQATDDLQHAPAQAPVPDPVVLTSTFGAGAVIQGVAPLAVDAPGRQLDHVDFAVDGTGVATATEAPFEFDLDTARLANGPHQLAVNASFSGGGYAIAVFTVTVANDGSADPTPPSVVSLAIAKSSLPASVPPAPAAAPKTKAHLYHAVSPAGTVSVKQFDAALVAYLGLGAAAREIQSALATAGLQPPPNTGTEVVARMLELRVNHPAAEDSLELLPGSAVTRAEAAWSFAQVLRLDPATLASVQSAADSFTLPALSDWQRRILTTAVQYVGYPYVWGGTSPTTETLFGVRSAGGFDCSGFVWQVYKLTSYPDEGNLAGMLRGRTTYDMSGEVSRRKRIPAAKLQPADVMFFGAKGPRSSPRIVDHAAIYLGGGWFIQSSDEGVTLLPFGGGWTGYFAWGRRPLREAGLTR